MKLTTVLKYLRDDLAQAITSQYEDYLGDFEEGEEHDDLATFVAFSIDELTTMDNYEISAYITAAISNCGKTIGQIIDEDNLDDVIFDNFVLPVGTAGELVYAYLFDVLCNEQFIVEVQKAASALA